jgi:hypothetical protein
MSLLPSLLRSLLLTCIITFLAPVLLIGGLLLLLLVIEQVPVLDSPGQSAIQQVVHFLNVFGNGSPFRGVVVIGMVCSLVGMMFDAYSFSRRV